MKLHIGCGTNILHGWINVDRRKMRGVNLNWDITVPLPYEAGTADFIYHEHLFEHFTQEEGRLLLSDWYRVLKPGGVLRSAVPDLENTVHKYLDGSWRTEAWVKSLSAGNKTDAEYLNMSMRAWEHKFLYDYTTLEKELTQVGFQEVKRQELHQSLHPDLCNLECRGVNSDLIVEGKK